MAQIFKANVKKVTPPQKPIELEVDSLDHFGQGVARFQNRPVFIPGALPGEKVEVRLTQVKRKTTEAKLIKVIKASPKRIAPHCQYFDRCGGCSLQMLSIDEQLKFKESTVKQLFNKFSNTNLPNFEPIISAANIGYRRRARLHFLQDRKTKKLTFGFKKRSSRELIAIDSCPILVPELNKLINKLRALFEQIQIRRHLGHVELYQGQTKPLVYLRIMSELSDNDHKLLLDFAQLHKIDISIKVADQAVKPIVKTENLTYSLTDNHLNLAYQPGDFIQVNDLVNQQMVQQAINWLAPQNDERILDLFCGIGNFSLPLAQLCKNVVAIEGVEAMVAQGKENALANNLDNIQFLQRNLDEPGLFSLVGKVDKILLDPARPGALTVMSDIPKLKAKKIVYVSCNPVTLARDSKILLESGYKINKVVLLNMFPDTEHIETMVLFTKN